ncbi:MAG: methyltransferase domain-containing protein [Actinomycetes bacterium]
MGDGRWQVTGSAAEVYQRQLVPAIFAPWAPRVLDLAAPAAGARVLDVACGTGVVARLAAERVGPGGRVVGLDLNPGMLQVAAGLAVRGAPTRWVQADAGHLPFGDRSFEVVCCQLGLQYVPDRAAALAEMARVLAPGGRLAAMVWRSIEHSPGVRAAGRGAGPACRAGGGRDHAGAVRAGRRGDSARAGRGRRVPGVETVLSPWQDPAGLVFPIEALLIGARR